MFMASKGMMTQVDWSRDQLWTLRREKIRTLASTRRIELVEVSLAVDMPGPVTARGLGRSCEAAWRLLEEEARSAAGPLLDLCIPRG